MKILSTFLLVVTLLLLITSAASALHFAVFSIPFYGHFLPVKAIAEQLVLADHHVTVFAENLHWCESRARRKSAVNNSKDPRDGLRCIAIPSSGRFHHSVFEEICTVHTPSDNAGFGRIFDELVKHQAEQVKSIVDIAREEHGIHPFDAILYDMSTFIGADVAVALGGIPKIAVFPLVLTLHAAGLTPAVPIHGTGFPRNLTVWQRSVCSLQGWLTPLAGHILVSRIHQSRAAAGIHDRYYHDIHDFSVLYEPIIAPTIWGHDIGMPICPNVKPVGILEALPHPKESELEPELKEMFFKNECKNKQRVYINFGTLSVMSKMMFQNLTGAVKMFLSDEEDSCVIWKLRHDSELDYIEQEREAGRIPNQHRLVVKKRFNDPQLILPHATVFVSHCGDTSVGEAINKLTPVAGIPFFADQVDVCMRMHERGFGVFIGDKFEFTAESVVAAVKSIGLNSPKRPAVEKAIREVREIAEWLGGAKEAARWASDIVEKNITRAFHCRHFNPNALKYEMEGLWGDVFQRVTQARLSNVLGVFANVFRANDFDLHFFSGCLVLFWGSRFVMMVVRKVMGIVFSKKQK